MMPMMKAGLHVVRRALLASAGVLACMALGAASTRAQDTTSGRFEISFPATAHGEAVTGRVYVMLSRGNDREPRFQIGRTGVPFFGRDIDALAPGQVAIIDDTDLGSPLPSVRDIPPGDYYVQGFVNIYSAFPRADGHVVWMHDDRWEGQQWPRSPGNLYSTAQRVRIDPGLGGVIRLSAEHVIPPIAIPPDTEWIQDDFPRMLIVTFQHPNPYFDSSYAVNSVNVGPYGDAIMQELIPEVERRFRVISEPYARLLSGGSTGGWEALALQIFHPDFFGGTWAYCPDPVAFTDVERINIYRDVNAFYKQHDWRRVVTPNTRETNGEIRLTSRQRNHFELVNGTKGRSGEQFDIWSAVFGPLGEDGYFEPLFDKLTGEINPSVAEHWRDRYDLLHYLQTNWETVGPDLVDKIRIYVGNMDNFYLNNAVRELEAWMKTSREPHDPGFFLYGEGQGHCWRGPVSTAERLQEMARYIHRKNLAGTPTPWWPE